MKKILIILILSIILISGCVSKVEEQEEIEKKQIEKQEVEEIQEKVKIEECIGKGSFKIGDLCCKGTEELFLCGKDVDTYKAKLESAKKKVFDTKKEIIYLDNPKVSFQQPEGWKVLKDYNAGIFNIPISYYYSESENIRDTYEISLLYYEKGDKDLTKIKEAIYKMISKRDILRGVEKFHFYKLRGTYVDNMYSGSTEYYLDQFDQSDNDAMYYETFIIPYKEKYYIWLYRDWAERDYTGSYDKIYNDYLKAIDTFNFVEGTSFNKEDKIQDDYIHYYSLNFKEPTKVKYDLVSENNMHVYFVKSFDDFDKYARSGFKDEKRFEFYEECKHKSTKEAKGVCEITTGGLMIHNTQAGYNNVNINLDWGNQNIN